MNKWLEATIEDIDHTHQRVLVHYRFWSSAKWDEWVDWHSGRLQPEGTWVWAPGRPFKAGQWLDVYDPLPGVQKYLAAKVIGVDAASQSLQVHFDGYAATFDETLSWTSDRIAPFEHKTRAKVQPFCPDAAKQNFWQARPRVSQFAQAASAANVQQVDPRLLQYFGALHGRGLRVEPMGGDGNCLFRSVAHQVYGTQDVHAVCRGAVAEYMSVEREFYRAFVVGAEEDFEEYLTSIRADGTWGDDPEIQALCELYDRPAEIWAYSEREGAALLRKFNSQATDSRPPIRLSYYGGGHYDSVVSATSAAHLLTEPPGVREQRVIAAARRRRSALGSRDAAAAVAMSDAEATEAAALQAALAESRRQFDDNVGDSVEVALLVSLGVDPQAAVRVQRQAAARAAAAAAAPGSTGGGSGSGSGAASASASAAAPATDATELLTRAALAATDEAETQRQLLESAQRAAEEEQMQAVLRASAAEAVVADEEEMIQAALRESVAVAAAAASTAAAGDADMLYDASLSLTEEEQLECAMLNVSATEYLRRKQGGSSGSGGGGGSSGGGRGGANNNSNNSSSAAAGWGSINLLGNILPSQPLPSGVPAPAAAAAAPAPAPRPSSNPNQQQQQQQPIHQPIHQPAFGLMDDEDMDAELLAAIAASMQR